MTQQTFNGISHFYTYSMARSDSKRSIAGYRLRKFIKTKRFIALLVLAVPFLMLAGLGQKKEIGLVVAVGMSAALLAHTTLV